MSTDRKRVPIGRNSRLAGRASPVLLLIVLLGYLAGVGLLAGEERRGPLPSGPSPASELERILREKGAEAAKKLEQLPGVQPPAQPAPGTPPVPSSPPSGMATPVVPGSPVQGPPQPPVGSFPPIRGRAAAPGTPAPGTQQPFVSFNFDNVDLYDFVSVVSEITGINYVIAPGVAGKITVQTTGKVATADVLPLFHTILDVYGLAAIQADGLYKIVPSGKARQDRIEVYIGKGIQAVPDEDRLIIQVLPLDYMPAARMADILKPYVSPQGSTAVHGPSNTLIFTELGSKIRSLLALVDVFDVDIFARAAIKLYPLQNAKAEDLAKELEKIYKSLNIADPSKEGGVEFVPIERLNSLLVISSTPKLLASVEGWITQLDIETKEAGVRIFVYNLEHSKASELASLLNQLYGKREEQRPRTRPGEPPARVPPGERQPPRPPTPRLPEPTSASPLGEVEVVAYEPTNSLVVRAAPTDYRIVERTIKELDARPRQVLIEALIAEITLEDEMKFGVQWTLTHFTNKADLEEFLGGLKGKKPPEGLGSLTDLGRRAGGLTYAILKRDNRNLLDLTLDLFARDSKINILSSPHVVATDNKEARIEVADEVPVRTSTSTGDTDRVVDQFQFRDTGIILTVTPHINSKDLVNLEIAQEVSEQGPTVDFGGGNFNTSFTKRQVKTTVLVQNGDTLILGGLIEEKLDYSDSGVPFLKDVPLIKYLFSSRRNFVTKTELLITITPHVIASDYDARAITEEFEQRVTALRKRMEQGKWGKKNRRVLSPAVPPDSSVQPPEPPPPPASGSQLPSPVPPAATMAPSQLPPKPAGSN